jgi:pyruvate kinase
MCLIEFTAYSSVKSANLLGAAFILCATDDYSAVKLLAKYKPNCPILAASTNHHILRQLSIFRSVLTMYSGSLLDINEVIRRSTHHAFGLDLFEKSTTVVVFSVD